MITINFQKDPDVQFPEILHSHELEQVIERAIHTTFRLENIFRRAEINVSLVSDEKIKLYNSKFREKDEVTDVLSFPQYSSKEEILLDNQRVISFGDIVICVNRAVLQANEFGHSFEREISYLTVHSCLHLLGYDHIKETDKQVMRVREKEITRELGIFKNN